MRTLILYLTLLSYLFCVSLPILSSDPDLRRMMEHAMQGHVVLQVRTGHSERYVGIVTGIDENEVVLLNPITGQTESVRLSSIQDVKQVKVLGTESRAKLEPWAGKQRLIRIELLDNSIVAGRVLQVEQSGVTMLDPKAGRQFKVDYQHVKQIDREPTGQKVIRKAMIGVGIGLASLLFLAAALLGGD